MGARHSGADSDPTTPHGQALGADDETGVERTRLSDPLRGKMLGEYRVEERIGHGGMGLLYRGVQPLIEKPVAIKVVLQEIASDPAVAQRMLEEARAASAVHHPNIIDIFAFGTLPDGRPYMVMELLQGEPLSALLRQKGRLTAGEVLTVLAQSMSALEAAHAAGVVHRDLKPENIFVTRGSEGGWSLKLIDFGLAKREGKDQKLTRPGMVMGTPGFMAPEQVRGDDDVSGKADVYSMGVVAWTLLMGREPFTAGSVVEVLHQHLSAPVPAIDAGPLPEGLEALVLRMMKKDPAERPDAAEVRRIVAGLTGAPPRRPSRPRPLLALGATAAVLALASVGLWLGTREPQPVAPPVVAPPPPRVAVRPVAVPVEVEPVTEPPPKPEPELPPGERRWPCAKVTQVTPVLNDFFYKKWFFFSIGFDYDRSVVVFTDGTNPRRVKALEKQRDAVDACRASARAIRARQLAEKRLAFHTTFQTAYGGDMVELDDFSLLEP